MFGIFVFSNIFTGFIFLYIIPSVSDYIFNYFSLLLFLQFINLSDFFTTIGVITLFITLLAHYCIASVVSRWYYRRNIPNS